MYFLMKLGMKIEDLCLWKADLIVPCSNVLDVHHCIQHVQLVRCVYNEHYN